MTFEEFEDEFEATPTKPARPSSRNAAAFLFRKHKKGELLTEVSMEVDAELVFQMKDRNLRVQDILDWCTKAEIGNSEEVRALINWYRENR